MVEYRKLRVKIGTHPAYYAEVLWKRKLPKVGDIVFLKNELKNGKPLKVRCFQIKDLGDELLYYMER